MAVIKLNKYEKKYFKIQIQIKINFHNIVDFLILNSILQYFNT